MKSVKFVAGGNGLDINSLPEYMGDNCEFESGGINDHLAGIWEFEGINELTSGQDIAKFRNTETGKSIIYGVHANGVL